ncbi:peptidoglycan-binding protein [Cucumibacter marinus]|uniref:peptidoglycan-binding protein n=1 Tax=Cucumibacter marinus TaxID=1121252 RepID=UPI0004264BAB|nr:peptidoglycan-binding protein [Cucumibacter marinus]
MPYRRSASPASSAPQLHQGAGRPDDWLDVREDLEVLLNQIQDQIDAYMDSDSVSRRQTGDTDDFIDQIDALKARLSSASRVEEAPAPRMSARRRQALRNVQDALDRHGSRDAAPRNIRDREAGRPSRSDRRAGDPLEDAIAQIRAGVTRRDSRPHDHDLTEIVAMTDRMSQRLNDIERHSREAGSSVSTHRQIEALTDTVDQLARVVSRAGDTSTLERRVAEIAERSGRSADAAIAAVGDKLDALGSAMERLAQLSEKRPGEASQDFHALTERVELLNTTIRKLADFQVNQAREDERNGVREATLEQRDATRQIEKSVRALYDKIDRMEGTASAQDMERVLDAIAALARGVDQSRDSGLDGAALMNRLDELSERVALIAGEANQSDSIRADVEAMRSHLAGIVDGRLDAVQAQIATLGDRLDDAGVGLPPALEDRLNAIAERIDTLAANQPSGLDRDIEGLAGEIAHRTAVEVRETLEIPDLTGLVDLIATRTAAEVRGIGGADGAVLAEGGEGTGALRNALSALEGRIAALTEDRQPTIIDHDALDAMRSGIDQVDTRLERLEQSLSRIASGPVADAAGSSSAHSDTGWEDEPTAHGLAVSPASQPLTGEDAPAHAELGAASDWQTGALNDDPADLDLHAFGEDDAQDDPAGDDHDQDDHGQAGPAPSFAAAGLGTTAHAGDDWAAENAEDSGYAAGASRPSDRLPDPEPQSAYSDMNAQDDWETASAEGDDMPAPDLAGERPPKPVSSLGREAEDILQRATQWAPESEPRRRSVLSDHEDDEDDEGSSTAFSRESFIAAARRAAQRAGEEQEEQAAGGLFGRALSRLRGKKRVEEDDDAAFEAAADRGEAEQPEHSAPHVDEHDVPPEPDSIFNADDEEPLEFEEHSDEEGEKESFLMRHRKALLLGASVIAISLMTLNLIDERIGASRSGVQRASTTPEAENISQLSTEAQPAPRNARAVGPDMVMDGEVMNEATYASTPIADMIADPFTAPEAGTQDLGIDRTITTASIPDDAADAAAPVPNRAAPMITASAEVPPPPVDTGPEALRQAAASGDARAQFEIGAIYTEGQTVEQDLDEAFKWYERAATAGFAPAQYRLGSLYENGRGVAKDLEQARLWYERAAEAGNRMAMHNLASLFASGALDSQDFTKAAHWFESAAQLGVKDSQFNLGMLYARGLGVEQDFSKSYQWFAIAALDGDKDAEQARDDIARSLDPEALQNVQTLVDAWGMAGLDMAANYAPIGTWNESFDPGPNIKEPTIVSQVQDILNKLGYDAGQADGLIGPKTADAISSFEQSIGMNPSGAINPRLLAVLGSQPV